MRIKDWKRVLIDPHYGENDSNSSNTKGSRRRKWEADAVDDITRALNSKSPFIRLLAYLSLDSSPWFGELFLEEVQELFGPYLEQVYERELARSEQQDISPTSAPEPDPQPVEPSRSSYHSPTWGGIPIEKAYGSVGVYQRIRLEPAYTAFVERYGCKPVHLVIGLRVAATLIYLHEKETGKRYYDLSSAEQDEWLSFRHNHLVLHATIDSESLDRVCFTLSAVHTMDQLVQEYRWLQQELFGEEI